MLKSETIARFSILMAEKKVTKKATAKKATTKAKKTSKAKSKSKKVKNEPMSDSGIVIVDDDAEAIQLATAALMELGFRDIKQFYDGQSFLDNVEEEWPFELLIVDERMGALSGLELISSLKKYEVLGLRILLMSGMPLLSNSGYTGVFLEKALDFTSFMDDLKGSVLVLLD